MSFNFDPLIKREFDRLGFNIIENEDLADLIITRVKREKRKKIYIGIGIAVTALAALLALYFGLNSGNSNAAAKAVGSSLSTPAGTDGSQQLPLTGYVDIDGSKPNMSKAVFLFDLQMGQMMQEITDNPDPIQGVAGKIEVFYISKGMPERLVQTYDMGSHTQINEFGVNQTGQYRWVLTFNDVNFKGRVRFAFVRTH
jgi:hypothetical protein